jgi:hypothetical protein
VFGRLATICVVELLVLVPLAIAVFAAPSANPPAPPLPSPLSPAATAPAPAAGELRDSGLALPAHSGAVAAAIRAALAQVHPNAR